MGEAAPLKEAARLGTAKQFLPEAITGEWVSSQDLIEQAKEKRISEKLVDEALRALLKDRVIEAEKRKPEKGPGGKKAFLL